MRPDGAATIRVTTEAATRGFADSFVLGRDPACDVAFEGNARVSRRHARVFLDEGRWWIEDLNSANGVLVDGVRVRAAEIDGAVGVQLGEGGPLVTLEADPVPVTSRVDVAPVDLDPPPPDPSDVRPAAEPPADERPTDVRPPARPEPRPEARPGPGEEGLTYEEVLARYFTPADDADDDTAGERTRFIRQAYSDLQQATQKEQTTRETRYRAVIVASVLVGILAVGYAAYREMTVRQLRAEAQALFFEMRRYDVAVAQQVQDIEREIEAAPESADSLRGRLDEALETRRRTAARYDQFVRGLGVYDGLSSEEEAIYRVARAFGESELMIPPEFVDEVKVYIDKWRRSSRFQTAVRTAQVNGYIPLVVDALRRNGLPPEFFYLSMQESNFDTRAVGPPTRYGYAKGAWQFIPETGQRYGLEPGPLVAQRVYDPLDERQQFDQAVEAAAQYLHDIYVHLSQASGLLVCASYNWGEHRVREKMRGIANDPEHRTYWRFLTEYRTRMPEETKGYVMNIFAAAVIGQNPRMFGIDMDPPLAAALAGGGGGAVRDDGAGGARRRMGTGALEGRRRN